MSFKTARINAGKRVAEIKEYMGVSDAAVYLWETGQSYPTADKLPKIAAFYGCTIEQLLAPDEEGA